MLSARVLCSPISLRTSSRLLPVTSEAPEAESDMKIPQAAIRAAKHPAAEKQRAKSLETMEIYAPIAHRLGMQRAKWELEDLSLQYLDPEGYKEITDALKILKKSLI